MPFTIELMVKAYESFSLSFIACLKLTRHGIPKGLLWRIRKYFFRPPYLRQQLLWESRNRSSRYGKHSGLRNGM